jgi:hypothetical protein
MNIKLFYENKKFKFESINWIKNQIKIFIVFDDDIRTDNQNEVNNFFHFQNIVSFDLI